MDFTQLFQDQAVNMLKGKVTEMLGETAANSVNMEEILKTVTGQLGKNSATEEGINGLMSALEKHTGEGIDLDLEDGKNILSHIFGGSESTVEGKVAAASNLSSTQSKDLLALASSFVMENLGNKKAAGELDPSTLGGLSKLATTFLDADKDGSIIDDIVNMIKNLFFKKK